MGRIMRSKTATCSELKVTTPSVMTLLTSHFTTDGRVRHDFTAAARQLLAQHNTRLSLFSASSNELLRLIAS